MYWKEHWLKIQATNILVCFVATKYLGNSGKAIPTSHLKALVFKGNICKQQGFLLK